MLLVWHTNIKKWDVLLCTYNVKSVWHKFYLTIENTCTW